MTDTTKEHKMPLSVAGDEFLAEKNHVCTLTTARPDGSPHVVPVRFTWDSKAGLVRIMTLISRRKVRNLLNRPGDRVAVCQVAGLRWVTLEGKATVSDDPVRVAHGVDCYINRYRTPPPIQPGLVVIEIEVERVMGAY
jgi:PPOX class probable F420-dependent enzyme